MTSGFRITLFAIISAASVAASGPVVAGDTLRCGSRIVSIDMIAAAVRAICGEPAYRDYWPSPDRRYWPGAEDAETWTYNFGPNQLLRILRFRGQRLRSIETDGYGFNGEGRISASRMKLSAASQNTACWRAAVIPSRLVRLATSLGSLMIIGGSARYFRRIGRNGRTTSVHVTFCER